MVESIRFRFGFFSFTSSLTKAILSAFLDLFVDPISIWDFFSNLCLGILDILFDLLMPFYLPNFQFTIEITLRLPTFPEIEIPLFPFDVVIRSSSGSTKFMPESVPAIEEEFPQLKDKITISDSEITIQCDKESNLTNSDFEKVLKKIKISPVGDAPLNSTASLTIE